MPKLFVRCPDLMIFEVRRDDLEPKQASVYDSYCYSDPDPEIEYIEYEDWYWSRMQRDNYNRGMMN